MKRRAFLAVLLFVAAARADTPPPPLARFSTTFQTDAEHKGRAHNVELAAEAIDGKTIEPNATFSFNNAVGERTAAFGFAKAAVIRDGMMAEGTGGGACQVASTLHAAALLAGLGIKSRAPHTRPSAYIRMGLDATVAYPTIDLVLENPRSQRVTIRAKTHDGLLDVRIEGEGERPTVTLTTEILERTGAPQTIERDTSVPGDTVRVAAFGIPGYKVRRTREIRWASEPNIAHANVRVDTYAPVPKILRVAPSFDVARLAAEPAEHDDEGETNATSPVKREVAPGVVRPALVQLRPSTTVTLTNASTTP